MAIGAGIAGHNIYKTRSKVLGDLFGNTSHSAVSEYQDSLRSLKSGTSPQSAVRLGEQIRALGGKKIPVENVMSAWHTALRAVSDEGPPCDLIPTFLPTSAQDLLSITKG